MSRFTKVRQGAPVEFSFICERLLINDFKTNTIKYQVKPMSNDFDVVFTNKLNVTNIEVTNKPTLVIGGMYKAKTIGQLDLKYGPYYVVTDIEPVTPNSHGTSLEFLSRHISQVKAERLLDKFPNVIEDISNGIDVDIKSVHGFGVVTEQKLRDVITENFKAFRLFDLLGGLMPFNFVLRILSSQEEKEGELRSKGVFSDPKHIVYSIKKSPYRYLSPIRGMGFAKADELISSIINKNKDNGLFKESVLVSNDRFIFAIEFYISNYFANTGSTYIEINTLRSKVMRAVVGITSSKFEEAIRDDKFVVFDDFITSKSMYDKELYIKDKIQYALDNKVLERVIARSNIFDGYELTNEQMKVLPMLLSNKVSILNGYAGTGKTTVVKYVLSYLKENGFSYTLMTPTGKASKVLSIATGEKARTIHAHLKIGVNNDLFSKNDNNKIKYVDTEYLIVDESSMIDTSLMYELLKRIDFNKTSVLFIGDNEQLPSVGPGNVFSVLLNSKLEKVTLDKVHRYAAGGLDTVVANSRLGVPFAKEGAHSDDLIGSYYEFNNGHLESLVDDSINKYIELLNSGIPFKDILFLTFKRAATDIASSDYINKAIQDYINPVGIQINNELRLGDYVMQVVNNYNSLLVDEELIDDIDEFDDADAFIKSAEWHILNGTCGTIVKIYNDGCIVDFDGEYIYYDQYRLGELRLSYAMTIHKSQGSQGKHVIVLTPKEHQRWLSSNLLYVAISRSQLSCYHYGDIDAVNNAVRVHDHQNRRTNLENFFLK